MKDAKIHRDDLEMFQDEEGRCARECQKEWVNHFKTEINYEKEQRSRIRQKTDDNGQIEREFRSLKDLEDSQLRGKKGKSRKDQYKVLRKIR